MLTLDYDHKGFLESVGDTLGFMDRRIQYDLKRFKRFIESRGSETGVWRGPIEDRPDTTL